MEEEKIDTLAMLKILQQTFCINRGINDSIENDVITQHKEFLLEINKNFNHFFEHVNVTDVSRIFNYAWDLLESKNTEINSLAATLVTLLLCFQPSLTLRFRNLFKLRTVTNEESKDFSANLKKLNAIWDNRYLFWKYSDKNICPSDFKSNSLNHINLPVNLLGIQEFNMCNAAWSLQTQEQLADQLASFRTDPKFDKLSFEEKLSIATKNTMVTSLFTINSIKIERSKVTPVEQKHSNLNDFFRKLSVNTNHPRKSFAKFDDVRSTTTNLDAVESENMRTNNIAALPTVILKILSTLCKKSNLFILDKNGYFISDKVNKLVWKCMLEEPLSIIKTCFEKLTESNLDKRRQKEAFYNLWNLIQANNAVPAKFASLLINHIIGLIGFYSRKLAVPHPNSMTLSEIKFICLQIIEVIHPHVIGVKWKQLKQALRKVSIDLYWDLYHGTICTKTIIVHGPDDHSIPTKLNEMNETTAFAELKVQVMDYFDVEESEDFGYYLSDKNGQYLYSDGDFVRFFFPYDRNQKTAPEIKLIKLAREKAYLIFEDQFRSETMINTQKIKLTLNSIRSKNKADRHKDILDNLDEIFRLPDFPIKITKPIPLEIMFDQPLSSDNKELFGIFCQTWCEFIHLIFSSIVLAEKEVLWKYDLLPLHSVLVYSAYKNSKSALLLRIYGSSLLTASYIFSDIWSNIKGGLSISMHLSAIFKIYKDPEKSNEDVDGILEYIVHKLYVLHRQAFIIHFFATAANVLYRNQTTAGKIYQLLVSLSNHQVYDSHISEITAINLDKPVDTLYNGQISYIEFDKILVSASVMILQDATSERSLGIMTLLQKLLRIYLEYQREDITRCLDIGTYTKSTSWCKEIYGVVQNNVKVYSSIYGVKFKSSREAKMKEQKMVLSFINSVFEIVNSWIEFYSNMEISIIGSFDTISSCQLTQLIATAVKILQEFPLFNKKKYSGIDLFCKNHLGSTIESSDVKHGCFVDIIIKSIRIFQIQSERIEDLDGLPTYLFYLLLITRDVVLSQVVKNIQNDIAALSNEVRIKTSHTLKTEDFKLIGKIMAKSIYILMKRVKKMDYFYHNSAIYRAMIDLVAFCTFVCLDDLHDFSTETDVFEFIRTNIFDGICRVYYIDQKLKIKISAYRKRPRLCLIFRVIVTKSGIDRVDHTKGWLIYHRITTDVIICWIDYLPHHML